MMPQMPSREKLLAWIDQVSFAVVEMNLYLDTHPEDEDALAFFREICYSRIKKQMFVVIICFCFGTPPFPGKALAVLPDTGQTVCPPDGGRTPPPWRL